MKVRDEINKYADEKDKPCLLWLLTHYHWESQFMFVATCGFKRYGTQSYETHRIWIPTKEGKLLYKYRDELTKELPDA
jgi:hypothetical protein